MWLDAESADSVEAPRPLDPAEQGLIGSTLLGTYAVDRVLGEGGMGRIYEAHHVRVPTKRFAVKVLRPELAGNAHVRARFEREMEAIARVTHPGVLAISDVGATERGLPFMVCEHLSGLDLLAYLRRFGALSNERVVQMGCRVAEALEAAHAQGVIHRDVKPSNVFLLGAFEPLGPEWDRVKLIDFGLSRLSGRDDQLTETGIVLGTPSYMAPEQARGLRTDHRTDVYGVGAVLYTAATGVPPFREATPQQTLIAVMSREPRRPRELNPKISDALELVIQRAMSKEPERRHASISALLLALSELERQSSPRAARVQPAGSVAALGGVRGRFVALAASAALLAAGALLSVAASVLPRSGLELGSAELITLATLLLAAAALGVRALQRFEQHAWKNTARLAERLPRLRAPLLAGLLVYGLGSFAVRFVEDVLPRLALGIPGEPVFDGRAEDRPDWAALLSLAALASATATLLHQSWWQPMRPRQRWLWGPALASAAVLPLALFSQRDSLERDLRVLLAGAREAGISSTSLASGAPTPAPPAGAVLGGAQRPGVDAEAGAPASAAPAIAAMTGASAFDAGPPPDAGTSSPIASSPLGPPGPALDAFASALGSAPAESSAAAALSGVEDPALTADATVIVNANAMAALAMNASSPVPGAAVGMPAAAIGDAVPAPASVPASSSDASGTPRTGAATSIGEPSAEDIEAFQNESGALAGSANDMPRAVQTIERLLARWPGAAREPLVRRVLMRAASMGGEGARAAFRVMGSSMGSAGPDLLYDIMLTRPALADQAKYLLSRHRVRRLFSPELTIAYDLRFSSSCGARLGLLERASDIGDQRSINTLAALMGNSPRCGQPGRSPCLERCERESVQFTRAIDAIVRRLRASERAASMN